MKKLLFICAVVALASCGGIKTESESTMTMEDSIASSDSTFATWADSVAAATECCDTTTTATATK